MPELLKPCPFCGGRDIRPNRDDLSQPLEPPGKRAATFPPQTKQEVVDEIAKRLEVSQDEKLLRIVLRMLS